MPTAEILATAMEMSIATLMLLFAGYLIFGTGNRNAPAVALATLTASIGLSVIFSLLGSAESFEYLRRCRVPLALLTGPALFVYVSRVSRQHLPMVAAEWLHLIPAAGGIVLVMSPFDRYTDSYLNFCIGAYWLASALVYWQRRQTLLPVSVRRFTFGLVVVFGLVYLLDVVLSVQAQAIGVYRNLPAYLLGLLIIFAGAARMMWIALTNPQLLAAPKLLVKYARSALDETSTRRLGERLARLMENESLFLEENISLALVADRLNVQARHVSQAVNTMFNCNFSAYVNEQRVREAARRLETTGKTVSQVMYEVGFSSKSSFNREFRRHLGMTPKDWRASRTGQRN